MTGNPLAVQWLELGAFFAVGSGLIPGRGIKIPQAAQSGQKKKKTCLIVNNWKHPPNYQ